MTTTQFRTARDEVLSQVPEEHRTEVGLHANLLLNTGGGRPSDAARQAVREYQRLGIEGLRAQHQSDHRSALEACARRGCAACQADL